ncbi:MAG: ATP synthase F1 subunit epsilon [Hydrogenothermaceae bacterium]|nr:ATP synthase F1 subunit epsilon [Hydrogenothermaceae bacterium]
MYKLDVVTPKGLAFTGEVYQTVITTADGEIGVLENHMLLLTNVKPGKLRIEKGNGEIKEFAVTYGILDVAGNRVIALLEEIYDIDSIDLQQEKQLLEEANQKLQSENLTDQEREYYLKQKERAEVLINLAKTS